MTTARDRASPNAIVPPRRPSPPCLAWIYPCTGFTSRQRNVAVRLLNGEDIRFNDLHRHEREAAFQLHTKRVVTFAPMTSRLMLTRSFPDGSQAVRASDGFWTVAAGGPDCAAARWTAQANVGRD